MHKRVVIYRGPASAHQCVGCLAQAAEWATVHGETGQDPWADYVPLCIRCHQRYDDHAGYKRGKPLAEIPGFGNRARTHRAVVRTDKGDDNGS